LAVHDRKSPWSWLRWVILILCFFILLDVVGVMLLNRAIGRAVESCFSTTFPDIAEATGVKFPKGSKLLESSYSGLPDIFIEAKVEMSRSDVLKFIRSLPGVVKRSHTSSIGVTNPQNGTGSRNSCPTHEYEEVWVTDPKRKEMTMSFEIHFYGPSKVIVYMHYCSG
jgi:hypothetical protein